MVGYCCVAKCNHTSANTKMHVLPKNEEDLEKWCHAIGRVDLLNVSIKRQSYRVCDAHFAECDKFPNNRNRTNLKAGSIPTVNLPDVDRGFSKTNDLDNRLPGPFFLPIYINGTPKRAGSSLESDKHKIKNIEDTPRNLLIPFITPKTSLVPSVAARTRSRKDLTSKVSKLYRISEKLKRTAKRLEFENADNKKRIKEALKYSMTEEYLQTKLNKNSLNFLISQQKNSRGRRFSMEDKIFALSLMKQRPKSYKLLQKTFALPSRKTLTTLLNKVPFVCGINEPIINSLKESVSKMDHLDRYCSLIFDEMALEPSISYNKKNDSVEGFEDCGTEKRKKFADHAMVFMARGLCKKWKQPIAYFFSESGMGSADLARNIKLIIQVLQDIGLIVVMTICDQYFVNRAALKSLKNNTHHQHGIRDVENRLLAFSVDGNEVISVYDPPHLIKGIRNDFVEHDVEFTWQNEVKVASWSDIIKLYEMDVGDYTTRMCYKLTDAHIYRDKMKKMKVKMATQVFSQRVSSTLRWTANHGRVPLSPTVEGTAQFISFWDQLFDSMNGFLKEPEPSKPLRCAVKDESQHIQFWNEAIRTLESVKLITQKGKITPPSVTNWIVTIKGMKKVWMALKTAGFSYFCIRNANQDPLENFIGYIRSNGSRNINPTCSSFISSYKSLIINNFLSTHSPSSNCEMDEGTALNSLRRFLTDNHEESKQVNGTIEEAVWDDFSFKKINFHSLNTHAYISEHIARRILKTVEYCKTCEKNLKNPISSAKHRFIQYRGFKLNSLLRANTQYRNIFSYLLQMSEFLIKKYCLENDLMKKIKLLITKKLSNILLCDQHNLLEIFVEKFLFVFIHSYFKNVNLILSGKYLLNINDDLKRMAFYKYKKFKPRKIKMNK